MIGVPVQWFQDHGQLMWLEELRTLSQQVNDVGKLIAFREAWSTVLVPFRIVDRLLINRTGYNGAVSGAAAFRDLNRCLDLGDYLFAILRFLHSKGWSLKIRVRDKDTHLHLEISQQLADLFLHGRFFVGHGIVLPCSEPLIVRELDLIEDVFSSTGFEHPGVRSKLKCEWLGRIGLLCPCRNGRCCEHRGCSGGLQKLTSIVHGLLL